MTYTFQMMCKTRPFLKIRITIFLKSFILQQGIHDERVQVDPLDYSGFLFYHQTRIDRQEGRKRV